MLNGSWYLRSAQSDDGPVQGNFLVVSEVETAPHYFTGDAVQYLTFTRWPRSSFAATGFRRIAPAPSYVIAEAGPPASPEGRD